MQGHLGSERWGSHKDPPEGLGAPVSPLRMGHSSQQGLELPSWSDYFTLCKGVACWWENPATRAWRRGRGGLSLGGPGSWSISAEWQLWSWGHQPGAQALGCLLGSDGQCGQQDLLGGLGRSGVWVSEVSRELRGLQENPLPLSRPLTPQFGLSVSGIA